MQPTHGTDSHVVSFESLPGKYENRDGFRRFLFYQAVLGEAGSAIATECDIIVV
jgi:hypothetical protein